MSELPISTFTNSANILYEQTQVKINGEGESVTLFFPLSASVSSDTSCQDLRSKPPCSCRRQRQRQSKIQTQQQQQKKKQGQKLEQSVFHAPWLW